MRFLLPLGHRLGGLLLLLSALALGVSPATALPSGPELLVAAKDKPTKSGKNTGPSLLVFGDSYTEDNRNRLPSWAQMLVANGDARSAANYAKSGATAEDGRNGTRLHFKGQVDAWSKGRNGGTLADVTVVYLGYNDIKTRKSLATAKADYTRQIDRLIAAGVTKAHRRLVLVQLHDWSRNPARSNTGGRVQEWNRHVVNVARARPNVQVLDLYTLFNRVFANPKAYGLTNVTKADRKNAATTALFIDPSHFGPRGREIIAQAVKSALSGVKRRQYQLAEEPAAAPAEAIWSALLGAGTGLLRPAVRRFMHT